MNKILSNYHEILKQIRFCKSNLHGKYCEPKLIAVSKQFPKETIQILVKQALLQARMGCDVISPSDMMDGRIKKIRVALEEKGF